MDTHRVIARRYDEAIQTICLKLISWIASLRSQ